MIYLDHTVDISDVANAVWRFSNNVDPKRDHFIYEDHNFSEGVHSDKLPPPQEGSNFKPSSHIAFDGTRKTKELDGFEREWPNILVSDDATIKRVDKIWDKLGLGKFIPSPSLKYREHLYKGGAVAQE